MLLRRIKRARAGNPSYGALCACSLAALGLVFACSGGAAAPKAQSPNQRGVTRSLSSGYLTPATVFAATDPELVSVSRLDPDGRRLLVSQGLRMIQHRDGSLERASELLPAKEAVRIAVLPPRLGGGYLFYVTSSSATLIWLAREFTGELEPLANVDFAVEQIVAGFDRLYLMRSRTAPPVAIDVDTGEALDVGPLPASPSYEALAVADAWMGAVEVPLRGVLATFDAGASWHPVLEADKLVGTELGPFLRTDDGWAVLDIDGVLRHWESPTTEAKRLGQLIEGLRNAPGHGANGASSRELERGIKRPLGREPLRLAVLHGVLGPKGSAYVAHLGTLARVRLRDGKIMEAASGQFPENATCHGIRLGAGHGFVCSEERGKTRIYAFEPPLRLESVMSFDEPRYVAANEHGGLVIRGRCSSSLPKEPGYYCLLGKQEPREIRVRGDVGAERVALLKDGTAVVIVPPRKGARATLTRVDASGKSKSIKLKLPKSGPAANLIREGIWLDGFFETDQGVLHGWVAGGGPFVGIRIKPDGTVEGAEVKSDIERALISGRYAMLVTQYGRAQQTVDGGFEWLEVSTVEAAGQRDDAVPAGVEQGCSPLGCATAHWVRVGWSKPESKEKVAEAKPPERTKIPSPGGGRWSMHCFANGTASPRALPTESAESARERVRRAIQRATSLSAGAPQSEGTAWQPFLEARAPELSSRHLGFDLSVEYGNEELHGYAWGERGADWERTGKFLVRVLDRFAAAKGVWSTQVSKSPWPDEMSVAAAFGEGLGGGSASWQFEPEPSGREGLLLVRQQSHADLFVVAEGRAIMPIRGADPITRTSGVVKLGSTWHLGALNGDAEFAVYKIVGDRLELWGTYPFDEGQSGLRTVPRLVRNTHGDALALMLESTSSYFYPIGLEDAALEAPLVISPKAMAALPPSCEGNENGFTFVNDVSVAPYVELMGEAAAVNASRVEGRFTTLPSGVCVEALAARASAVLPESLTRSRVRAPQRPERAPVAMVLSEQGAASRRWEFDCYP